MNVNERRPYHMVEVNVKNTCRLAAALAIISTIVNPIQLALASEAVPAPAPDFRKPSAINGAKSGGTLDAVTFDTKPSVTVVPNPKNAPTYSSEQKSESVKVTPLNGRVSSQSVPPQTLNGVTSFITDTPPVMAAAVSKTAPPEMFRAWLEKAHPGFLLSVAQSAPLVVDVKGRWDDSSRTLRSLGIPYERIGSGELRDYSFERTKVLIVDCAGTVPKDAYQKVRDFVARGGFVLSTDWALDNLIERAFPGYVEYDRKKNAQAIYDAYVVNPDPALFVNAVTNAHWKMDEDSHLMRVLKPGSVRVLARSRKLESEDPASQGVLAVVFPFGRGYVMHMIGHFDNNGFFKFNNSLPDPAPSIGISLRQAIAANFIVAGLSNSRLP